MSWADNSSGSDDRIEIGAIRCQYCGQPFLEEMAKKNHELSCGASDDDEKHHDGGPGEDNKQYNQFLAWLRGKTDDGAVRFQSRSIVDSVDLSPNQIGVFMSSIEQSEDWVVERLSYSDRTLWEVSQA